MKKGKVIWSVLVITAILLHYTAVFSFVNPVKRVEGRWHYYTMFYLYPFFDQGWNLFAPAPHSNYHVFVTYKEGYQTKQFDLINEIQNKHVSNRFSGYETLSLAISNAIHNFEYATSLKQNLNGPISNDINFKVVQHFVNAFVMNKSNNKAVDIKFILLITHVNDQKQLVYY